MFNNELFLRGLTIFSVIGATIVIAFILSKLNRKESMNKTVRSDIVNAGGSTSSSFKLGESKVSLGYPLKTTNYCELLKKYIFDLELCTTIAKLDEYFTSVGMPISERIQFLPAYMGVVNIYALHSQSFHAMPEKDQYEMLSKLFVSGDWRQLTNKYMYIE